MDNINDNTLNITTNYLVSIHYLQISCKNCKTDLSNIKPTFTTLPTQLLLKCFYLKNIKFSSQIHLAKDNSYGFHKCKCTGCKAKIGNYVVMCSPLNRHLITSVIINIDNVTLSLLECNEDKWNTKYEKELALANSKTIITELLIQNFKAKIKHMKSQVLMIEDIICKYIFRMKEALKKMMIIKKTIIEFFIKIVRNNSKEDIEVFVKLIPPEKIRKREDVKDKDKEKDIVKEKEKGNTKRQNAGVDFSNQSNGKMKRKKSRSKSKSRSRKNDDKDKDKNTKDNDTERDQAMK